MYVYTHCKYIAYTYSDTTDPVKVPPSWPLDPGDPKVPILFARAMWCQAQDFPVWILIFSYGLIQNFIWIQWMMDYYWHPSQESILSMMDNCSNKDWFKISYGFNEWWIITGINPKNRYTEWWIITGINQQKNDVLNSLRKCLRCCHRSLQEIG